MLCDESSFTIPADYFPVAPPPMISSALMSLLLLQQHQQQQQHAVKMNMSSLLSTFPPALCLPQPSRQSERPPSPTSKFFMVKEATPFPATSNTTPPAPESPFSALEQMHIPQPHQPIIKPRRRQPVRGLQALAAQYDPDQVEQALDADQLKKLRKAERKKAREMNRKLICFNCGATQSPIWRRTEDKINSICNSCGLYYKNHKCHKPISKLARSDSGKLPAVVIRSPLNAKFQEFKMEAVPLLAAEEDFFNADSFNYPVITMHETILSPDSLTIPHSQSSSELSFEIEQFLESKDSDDTYKTLQFPSVSWEKDCMN
ncbi:hypothetical protein BC830DRAFT_1123364 [Chytriomyces sp. MP71]|nr:hypothetical protein BC830DRAFT_1123364 [Chytriomyces sp. MP71]